ncbi:MAG: TRAP transporter small permease [Rhodobiaceae bacterium]|nr:TRAP transporter small permease [Rhodobiaceae bacterium]
MKKGTGEKPEPAPLAFVEKASEWLALAGGAVLVVIASLTIASIIGRAFIFAGLSPVPGDFELVEAGTALAVFCFLPWCQLRGGHLSVDLLAGKFGETVDLVLTLLWNLMMTATMGLIAWRLWFGMLDKMRYNETSFILQIPVWIFYAVCIPAAVVAIAAGVVSAAKNARQGATTL